MANAQFEGGNDLSAPYVTSALERGEDDHACVIIQSLLDHEPSISRSPTNASRLLN